MRLRRRFLHRVSELFRQVVVFPHSYIVFIPGRILDSEHVFSIAVEEALRALVLHDATTQCIEVDGVGIAEPIVDDHGQVKLVLGVCLVVEIDGILHDEVVLVNLGAFLVLPDAKVNRHRLDPSL